MRNKRALYERTKGRAGREWDQYEFAHKVWVKERDEAVEACQIARAARNQWNVDKVTRLADRDARERNRLDMPFRDARRSVLQKLRACNLDVSNPSRFLYVPRAEKRWFSDLRPSGFLL